MNCSNPVDFFEFLGPYRYTPEEMEARRADAEEGLIDMPALFEVVLAKLSNGKYKRKPKNGFDFDDYSEAKCASTSFRKLKDHENGKQNWQHSLKITSLSAKVGLVRIMGYNSYSKKFFFLAVPHSAYYGKTTIEPVLETFYRVDGKPTPTKASLKDTESIWRKYEVETIEELARA